MNRIMLLAQSSGGPIDAAIGGFLQWPWTWTRLFHYVEKIKAVYQRAAIVHRDDPDLATPPRWMFFDDEHLDKWWRDWEEDFK